MQVLVCPDGQRVSTLQGSALHCIQLPASSSQAMPVNRASHQLTWFWVTISSSCPHHRLSCSLIHFFLRQRLKANHEANLGPSTCWIKGCGSISTSVPLVFHGLFLGSHPKRWRQHLSFQRLDTSTKLTGLWFRRHTVYLSCSDSVKEENRQDFYLFSVARVIFIL